MGTPEKRDLYKLGFESALNSLRRKTILILATAISAFTLAGCVTLVTDYDEEQAKRSQVTLESVLSLYDRALEEPDASRQYSDFADGFGQVETQLRVLSSFARVKAKNEDSQKIIQLALDEWIRQRNDWKDGSVPIAQIIENHRRNMVRMMSAAIQAEEWKKLGSSQ